MKQSSISIERTHDLLKKAQEIIEISPDLSLKYVLLAQERATTKEKHLYFGVFNKIIGECYFLLDDLVLAKDYILQAKGYYDKVNDLLPKLQINSLLAKWFIKNKETDKAVELYHEMILTSTSLHFNRGVVLTLHEMAEMYLKIGKYNLTFEILKSLKEKDFSEISDSILLKIYSNKILASIKCNQTEGLEDVLAKSMDIAIKIDDDLSLKICYENYYHYYKLVNDIPHAFTYLEKCHKICNKIESKNSYSKTAKLLNQYEIDKKEQKINLIQEKKEDLEEANNTIRKQKNFLETILDTIPNAVYYRDLSGNYLGYNKKWSDLFIGKSRPFNVNNLNDVLLQKYSAVLAKADDELLYKKHLVKYNCNVYLEDNREHNLVIYKDVFRDARGAIVGTIGVVNDNTDYNLTYLESIKTTNLLRAIFDFAPIGICTFNEEGVIDQGNIYLRNLLLRDPNSPYGNILDYVIDEDREAIRESFRVLPQNQVVTTVELRVQAQNGMIIYMEISFATAFNPIINKTVYVAILKNITDRKIYDEALRKSEKSLREANLTKDRFFSIIAHDLRGPIGNFREIFKLLASNGKIFSETERNSLMLELYKSADSTFDLLENLLQWTRSQRDELHIVPNYNSIYEIVSKTVATLQSHLNNKEIKIVSNIEVTHIGYFDLNMISTVIRNLFSNAIKFSHPKSTITLTSKVENDFIIISVEDQGVGIPKDKLALLFNSTDIISTPGTAKERGTGLGLILCKSFVDLNQGSIWVESEVGKGTTFSFSVPHQNGDQLNH